MARPKKRNLDTELKPKEAEIWEWVRECVPVTEICERLEIKSKSSFREWIKRDAERSAAYDEAVVDSAETHALLAKQVLLDKVEDGKMTSAQSTIVKQLSAWHLHMSRVRDRETFGEKPAQTNIALLGNVGDLHLDALRRYGSMDPQRLAAQKAIPVAEFTVEK